MTDTQAHITGIHTVGIPVSDQERALAFYRDALGFETRMDTPFGEGQRWLEVAAPGSATTVALVQAHDAYRAGVDAEIIPFPVPMFFFRDPDGNSLMIVEDAGA